VRVEEAWFVAIQNSLFAWWIRKAKDTMTVVWDLCQQSHPFTTEEGKGKQERGE